MFIDAGFVGNKIYLKERDKAGNCSITSHNPPYVYYVEDRYGQHRALDGTRVKRHKVSDRFVHEREVNDFKDKGKRIYESDVYPVYRFLEERYPVDENPPLNICFIDIEADKDSKRGWSKPRDPFTPITAITLQRKWLNQYITIATPPDTMTFDQARALLDSDPQDGFGSLTEEKGYFLVETEADMLNLFLDLIEDVDVFSGWHSMFYDIPYLIGRIRIVLGGEPIENIIREDGEINKFNPTLESLPHLLKLCAFPDLPKLRLVEQFGNKEITFELPGRPHCDYLEHYKKNTLEKKHSYTLDYILNDEIKQSKVKYDGSLDQLQRNDFRRFIAYSRQDVAGLSALDDKKKMIELANTVAHMSSVPLAQVLGTVTKIEMAVLRNLHRNGMVAPDRKEHEIDGAVPGAFVLEPDGGVVDWLFSIDIASEYPSIIRLCNISPEVLVGQFDLSRTEAKFNEALKRHKGESTAAWGEFTGVLEYHDLINEAPVNLTMCFEADGSEVSMSAADWKRTLLENRWSITGNGTVFDLKREGIIAECLTKWYNERAAKRVEAQKYKKLAANKDDPNATTNAALADYFDMVQNAMKLMLNSTYGAYLNQFFRFYDARCGRSVTLTGRVITKHMCRQGVKLITGNYDLDKSVVIYSDTDSAYLSIDKFMEQNGIEKTVENAIVCADTIGEAVNESFAEFMRDNFLVDLKRGGIIQAKRESVAKRALFKNAKKRYALYVVDIEGKRCDEIKTTGMDTRRTDTPKYVQKFLEHCLELLLKENADEKRLVQFIDEFREQFEQMPPWRIGSPCGVSKLTAGKQNMDSYLDDLNDGMIGMKKPLQHYSVKAALNTNRLMDIFQEHRWDYIRDGDKIEILALTKNEFDLETVAIKVGEDYVPEWFKALPFDVAHQEQKLINQKVENTLGILGWNFAPRTGSLMDLFE